MGAPAADHADRPPFDDLIQTIADYALSDAPPSQEAMDTARLCLLDTLGCGLLALRYPECTKLLGPITPGTVVPLGSRVPGTPYVLDPVAAAWNIGCIIRWLDFNDTWLAAEWGHPSDNLGGILSVLDFQARARRAAGESDAVPTVNDVLHAMIKAHEIQGVIALNNSFNRVGLDHVLLVKLATTAVVSAMMTKNRDIVLNAISLAFVDGQSLRTYRHAPNAGSRKSWAAGDATARGVQLALMAYKGEMGYPSAVTSPTWGFQDVLMGSNAVSLTRPLGSYVMENVLFKVKFPAEFHAQTAVEAAIALHPQVSGRLDDIKTIAIVTHESAIRIISKVGPLANPADRDHCLQYMTAIGLMFGDLTADHYEDRVANDPRIDALRSKMVVTEDEQYSKDYMDPELRSIANRVQVTFNDGTQTEMAEVHFPIGHRRRRHEAIPFLLDKFTHNASTRLPAHRVTDIRQHAVTDPSSFDAQSVDQFVGRFLPAKTLV